MTRRPAPPGRPGYTLLELLTVVIIIGILVSLLLPVIKQVRVAAGRGQTTHELNQLTTAVDAFKRDWGAVPPTSFRIPTNKDSNDASFNFLAKKYPLWAAQFTETQVISPPLAGAGTTLVGNQSMVYFLGGPTLTGWADDAPVAPSAGSNARKTYLEIPQDKLRAGNTVGYPNANPVYVDPYGIPYLYWGSAREVGRYTGQTLTLGGTNFAPLSESSPPNRFLNEKTCQIISAGADKKFGPGGAWAPGVGKYDPQLSVSSPLYPPDGPVGADDIANFNNGSELGKTP